LTQAIFYCREYLFFTAINDLDNVDFLAGFNVISLILIFVISPFPALMGIFPLLLHVFVEFYIFVPKNSRIATIVVIYGLK